MPYIDEERRNAIFEQGSPPMTAGELNYKLTTHILDYVDELGLNYQTLNDVMGALEGCKQEFYRRVVAPYEEKKRRQNGDVYGFYSGDYDGVL